LGVEVTLDKREWKYFLATRDNRAEWQVMRFAWVGDYNDARTFLEIFRSDSSQNLSGFDSPEYDRLLRASSETIDAEKRTKLMTQAEQQLLDEHPIAPLYFYVSKHLVNPAVRNFEANILDIHPSQFLIKLKDNNVH
jgi:oligopeptide transport system substrate-binding protein